jgi:WD40 repeat protein
LAWTSDGKKLISGSCGPIRIFDTATWEQVDALDGHLGPSSRLGQHRLLVSQQPTPCKYII